MCACAIDKCVTIGSFGGKRVVPSGSGNRNPSELSNGLPEIAAKRPFHIMVGIERRVGREWRATLIAGARAMGPDNIVVLDADRDRLRVAECPARRVTATASIVVVEAARLVEPQEPAEIGKLWVKRSPEPAAKIEIGSYR